MTHNDRERGKYLHGINEQQHEEEKGRVRRGRQNEWKLKHEDLQVWKLAHQPSYLE